MRLLISSVLIASITGCAEQPPATTSDAPPHLAVALTDAPAAFDSVWVEIASVEIESADAGWITLASTPQRFDLLTLQNDVTAALGDATLTAGTYGQLRLIVDKASVVVAGVESSLTIASGARTGIKVPLDQMVQDGTTYTVTLDYDASASIKDTGRGYLMTPVIQVKDFVEAPSSGSTM